ncbi:unnamed protein product [Boreogadus saida]
MPGPVHLSVMYRAVCERTAPHPNLCPFLPAGPVIRGQDQDIRPPGSSSALKGNPAHIGGLALLRLKLHI